MLLRKCAPDLRIDCELIGHTVDEIKQTVSYSYKGYGIAFCIFCLYQDKEETCYPQRDRKKWVRYEQCVKGYTVMTERLKPSSAICIQAVQKNMNDYLNAESENPKVKR